MPQVARENDKAVELRCGGDSDIGKAGMPANGDGVVQQRAEFIRRLNIDRQNPISEGSNNASQPLLVIARSIMGFSPFEIGHARSNFSDGDRGQMKPVFLLNHPGLKLGRQSLRTRKERRQERRVEQKSTPHRSGTRIGVSSRSISMGPGMLSSISPNVMP